MFLLMAGLIYVISSPQYDYSWEGFLYLCNIFIKLWNDSAVKVLQLVNHILRSYFSSMIGKIQFTSEYIQSSHMLYLLLGVLNAPSCSKYL